MAENIPDFRTTAKAADPAQVASLFQRKAEVERANQLKKEEQRRQSLKDIAQAVKTGQEIAANSMALAEKRRIGKARQELVETEAKRLTPRASSGVVGEDFLVKPTEEQRINKDLQLSILKSAPNEFIKDRLKEQSREKIAPITAEELDLPKDTTLEQAGVEIERRKMINKQKADLLKALNDTRNKIKDSTIKNAKDLRQEYRIDSRSFTASSESIKRVRAAGGEKPSAAGDLALIFNYMKILDPGSVVRESEFATAQNAAGVPERIRAKYNNIIDGERLSPKTRADFLDRAERLFSSQVELHNVRTREYTRLAKEIGADPEQVIVDLSGAVKDNQSQNTSDERILKLVESATPEEISALPENLKKRMREALLRKQQGE